MLDSHLVLYKSSFDLMIYLVAASPDENELMLAGILNALSDALVIILKYSKPSVPFISILTQSQHRNQVEKRVVLENIDLVLLAIDETFDEG